ncbi:Transcriptional regulator containing PAS, AAA-type ATPase, and DNA-binding Fis domains [Maridesulfovibrio ferrireducens]|uniref:Transcriptional regulator containing PAS, AAA-type ATPase, and DNA-binding Fis domains n=1 Tax=Maridesulfovibrio ferrireducens TaxID=246191 RepID=A0A1G9CXJ9_9BACT|nr:sigma 54-interacting transcriptional regulator [Maridesulfovibrio ferrireducens]SDK56406.1 Transcriptional regulator containing PAS, AAA-type ATPase, and DNA-binding Fis domains [Maridesulfovibrio ferrireducens]
MKNENSYLVSGLLNQQFLLPDLLDEIPVGIAILDVNGKIKIVNRTWQTITGAEPDSITGLKCMLGLRCDYCFKGCPIMSGKTDFDAIATDADIIDRSRIKIPIRLTISPLFSNDKKLSGFVETIQDIRQVAELSSSASKAYSLGGLVGTSPQMVKVFSMIPSIAGTDSSVLITGETGTGKDVLAEALHNASDRAGSPFIKVNCGALPETLLESELFGHVKGAFTGAHENRPGRIKLAHNGSFFLTEIGDLPLALQVKLLSFLDDKEIYPLGSSKGFKANVRIIVATHRDLKQMVLDKTFRADLLFRLNVVHLHLPPLRERGEDILLLKNHFLKEYCTKFNKKIRGFTKKSAKILLGYHFPGNVRELRNVVEYAVNFCDRDCIGAEHLPAYLTEQDILRPVIESAKVSSELPPQKEYSPAESWDHAEKRMIIEALIKNGGRKADAAKSLGWSRSTFWRKMNKHAING